MKNLVGRRITKTTKFLDEQVTIRKLSTAQALQIQAASAEMQPDDESQLNLIYDVIRAGVEGGSELTDEDFGTWPLEDISKLSSEIMKFSGLTDDPPKGK
jgi:hypothetical protein